MGFELCGATTVLLLFSCELFPNSPLNRLLMSYTEIAADLAFAHLYAPLANYLDERQDHLVTVLYFLPELVAAVLGGMIAAWLIPRGRLPGRASLREETTVAGG